MAGEETQYPQGRSSAPAADSPVDASVEQFLVRLHLGSLDASEDFPYPGRNHNRSGATDTGNATFVKRLKGNPKKSLTRYQRLMSFEQLMDRGQSPFPCPEFLSDDEKQRLLVFGMLDDIRSGGELAAEEEFTEATSEEAGRTVAAGVGRTALLDPRSSVSTVGLGKAA
ncbi:hypothetical protein [Streptomyces sp. NPDC058595]|uniref:hypothetical protein n=1 Tax=Streptomyces sp. NPDC058595 TaxID=3346550 RepID=UPI0036573810